MRSRGQRAGPGQRADAVCRRLPAVTRARQRTIQWSGEPRRERWPEACARCTDLAGQKRPLHGSGRATDDGRIHFLIRPVKPCAFRSPRSTPTGIALVGSPVRREPCAAARKRASALSTRGGCFFLTRLGGGRGPHRARHQRSGCSSGARRVRVGSRSETGTDRQPEERSWMDFKQQRSEVVRKPPPDDSGLMRQHAGTPS